MPSRHPPHSLDPLYALAFLYTDLGRRTDTIAAWERILAVLAAEYDINTGETVDWPKREIDRLKTNG